MIVDLKAILFTMLVKRFPRVLLFVMVVAVFTVVVSWVVSALRDRTASARGSQLDPNSRIVQNALVSVSAAVLFNGTALVPGALGKRNKNNWKQFAET